MAPELTPSTSAADDLYGRSERRVRRIAIFGPRGTGKTCFFASLYGNSADAVAALTFDHDPTMDYLERMWGAYSSEYGFPEPTPSEVPQRLIFHLAHQTTERQWQVEILDHAGEFVERARGGTHNNDLRDIVQVWLRDCEATLIFLDTSRGDSDEALERRNEVNILLQLCREASESGKVVRPLGLVLTKWDSHGPIGIDPAAERQRARDYLAQTPAFRQIHATVEAFGRSVEVFPVSALGSDRQPKRKPTNPYNLLRPLLWSLQQSDEGRLRAAESIAEARPQSLGRAVRAYQELIDLDGIGSGPVYERVAPRLAELKRKQGKWRLVKYATAAVLLLGLLAGGYFGWSGFAARQYQAWAAFCDNEGKSEASAGKRAAMADALLLWHGLVLSHVQKGRLEESRLRDHELERDYGERMDWRAIDDDHKRLLALEDPQQFEILNNLIIRLEAFGSKWKGLKVGQNWAVRLEEVKATLAGRTGQRDQFNRLLAADKPPVTRAETEKLIHGWDQYLKSEPKPSDYYRAKAEKQLTKWQDVSDTQGLSELLSKAGRVRTEQEECGRFIRDALEYRRNRYNKDKNGPETDRLIETELRKADELAYDQTLTSLSQARTSLKIKDLRNAQSKLSDYLNATEIPGVSGYDRPVLMRQAARGVRDWLEGTFRGRKYPLTLKSLFVPDGHKLFNNVFGATNSYAYALTLSGAVNYDTKEGTTAFSTPSTDTKTETSDGVSGVRVSLESMQKKFPPQSMDYTPGVGTLKVKVLRYSTISGWYEMSTEYGEDVYVPAALRRECKIFHTHETKGKLALDVVLDCEGAEIPELPRFQGGR